MSKDYSLTVIRNSRARDQRETWLQFLAPHSSRLTGKVPADVLSHKVCFSHFQSQYLRFGGTKPKKIHGAFPTLFTNAEILSGRPTTVTLSAGQVLADHTYYIKQKHREHNYCSTQSPSAEQFEPPVGKTHSDDEDWRETLPAYEDNSLPRSHTLPGVYGAPSSHNIEDKSTNDDAKHGIDPGSLDESEGPPTESIFSWQRQEILYPTEDTDVLMGSEMNRGEELEQDLEDLSMYDDPPAVELDTHAEYQCNVCENQIKGFRYTCVQCADWDLCAACEARAAHATHYVLRVPSPRPYNEIQAVLAAIRQQLLSENLFLSEQIIEDSLKSEPEEAEVEVEGEVEGEAEAAPAPPDPLRARSAAAERRWSPKSSDDEHTDGSEYRPPRRKRRRRPSDSSDSSLATTLPDTHNSISDTLLCSPIPTNFDELSPETPVKQIDTSRRKPLTRSATHPVKHLESNQSGNDDQPVNDVLELPAAVHQASNDLCLVPGTVFEVPGTIFEFPTAMGVMDGVLEVPDNATVFIQEYDMCDSLVDSIYTGEDVVGGLGDSGEVLHLRVPPDTDDAALVQALQSQAYVVMQPNLEDPDDSTVSRQEPPDTRDLLVDSIYTGDNAVGGLGGSGEVLHLRVPPDTDGAALVQALQSQAYVVMQPNLEDPDDSTVFRQEPPDTRDLLVDSISTEEDTVGSLGYSWEALRLRVPPDTDVAALTQALTCQGK